MMRSDVRDTLYLPLLAELLLEERLLRVDSAKRFDGARKAFVSFVCLVIVSPWRTM